MPSPFRKPRRYALAFLAFFGLLLAGSCLFNLLVNPYRVTPTPLSLDSLDGARDLYDESRTSVCGLILSAPEIDVALLGASRVNQALDPRLPEWGGEAVYNLACRACFFNESRAVLDYLLRQQDPKLVIWGLAPQDLASDADTRGFADFYRSPLAGRRGRLDRDLRYLVGSSTCESSMKVLARHREGATAHYSPLGIMIDRVPLPTSQRAYFEEFFRRLPEVPNPGLKKTKGLDPDKRASLAEAVRQCQRHGVRLVLFLHPQHSLVHAHPRERPLLPMAETRLELARLFETLREESPDAPSPVLWDFGGFHRVTRERIPADHESSMVWWDDFGHYAKPIGHLVLARMMDWPLPIEGCEDFGVELTPRNFPEWEDQVKREYAEYLEQERDGDVAWKLRHLGQPKSQP